MNSLPLCSVKWHYIGSDNKAYGPLSSEVMLQYYGTGYFHEDLMLSYDGMNFYILRDWIQICGKLPFTSEIGSAEAVNRLYGQIGRPHFRSLMSSNVVLSQSLPFQASSVNPFNGYAEPGIIPQQMSVPMPSDSMSSANTNGNPAPTFFPNIGQQQPTLIMCDPGVMLQNQFPDIGSMSFGNVGGEYRGGNSLNDNSQISYNAQMIRTDRGTNPSGGGLVHQGTQTIAIQVSRGHVETCFQKCSDQYHYLAVLEITEKCDSSALDK
uniref:GYF domain-containing protein n=1 Tax=Ditylenchus dipsaci TaxID=166011 RepID=A0A915CTI2_9BILA